MENEHISQFEDQPVIPDSVFDYTEDLHIQSVPIVIDNGKTSSSYYVYCHEIIELSLAEVH